MKTTWPWLLFMLIGLSSCTRNTSHLPPVQNFSVSSYLGQWHEIARLDHPFERGLEQVTAQYSLCENQQIKVLNRGYDLQDQRWQEAEGRAKFKSNPQQGHLLVSFFGPFYADYKIIHLDPDYQWAVVTSSTMDYLWILSRSPHLPPALKQQLLTQIETDGFDTQTLIWVDQTLKLNDSNYTLVWADEFDAEGRPDPNNWTYEQGFVRNEELQWYQPDNATCLDGLLVIEARREQRPNPHYRPDSRNWKQSRAQIEYTSSCLLTRGKHQWTYGRFEMRARFATGAGLWPAFWTLGSARAWPGCGEIDIMEYYRGDLLANACWAAPGRWKAVWDSVKKPVEDFNNPNWDQSFHVWRMDWTPEAIKLYVDDLLLNTIELDKTLNQTPDQANPFHEPHYILVNLAIGGTNGGDPSDTPFPTRYEIDYVRVYQKKEPTQTPTSGGP